MTGLQKQLKDIVLADPAKYNLDELHILLDTDWETTFKGGMPPLSQMISLHDWIVPFQINFTDEERKLVEEAVKSWGLSITSESYPAPSTHSLTFADESNKTRGFVAKVARGDILEKAKGNIPTYEYNYCTTAGNRKFIMQKYDQCDWTLQRVLDYIGKYIKPDTAA